MQKSETYFLGAILFCGLAMACSCLVLSYSYWWDELYSVVGARLSMASMMSDFIMEDVHPPFYQFALKLWITAFGDGERTTRALSTLFSLMTVLAFWVLGRRHFHKATTLTALTVMVSCSLFSYFAQETRSYSLLLLLTTCSTFLYLDSCREPTHRIKPVLLAVSLLLLSLTHYFGLIYSGTIILLLLVDARRDLRAGIGFILLGGMCLVWPAIHYLYGDIGSRTGQNFWIETNGIATTVATVSDGLTPQLNVVSEALVGAGLKDVLTAVVFTALLLLVILFSTKQRQTEARQSVYGRKLSLVLVTYIALIAFIDLHSPISTHRNFIVLLPAFSILITLAAQALNQALFNLATPALILFMISNLAVSALLLRNKTTPIENHRAAAQYIEANLSPGDVFYYLDRSDKLQKVHKLMALYYFEEKPEPNPIKQQHIAALSHNAFVLLQHHSYDVEALAAELIKNGQQVTVFNPHQKSATSVSVIEIR